MQRFATSRKLNSSCRSNKKVTYLGLIINENNDYTEEIKSRIGQGKSAFSKMNNVLCNRSDYGPKGPDF